MKVTIHQPEHMPWLGFFHKVDMADVYVVLDNVQYRRRYFQNRNKIRTRDGCHWITAPIVREKRDELLIKNVKLFQENLNWKKDNLETIYHSYSKAKFFKYYWEEFKDIYNKNYTYLFELNLALIKFFLNKIGSTKKVIFASSLNVSGRNNELILNICKTLGAKTYISGISGRDYLDFKEFNLCGIEIVIQEFHHPIYQQLYEPFIPCISVIDVLFNYGERTLEIINGVGVAVMEKIFL